MGDFVELGSFLISAANYTSGTVQRFFQGSGAQTMDVQSLNSSDTVVYRSTECSGGNVGSPAVEVAGQATLELPANATNGTYKVCGDQGEYPGLDVVSIRAS